MILLLLKDMHAMFKFRRLRRLFTWILTLFSSNAVYAGDDSQSDSSSKMFFRFALTLIILAFAGYGLLVLENDSQLREWIAAWIGVVIGYWFS